MRLIFGAPVALLSPYVGYMLIWIAAWIHNGAPGVAVRYWPPGLFCVENSKFNLFCSRSPDDLTWFILIGFFTCCLVGWEAVRILLSEVNDPDLIAKRKTARTLIVKGIAWSIVILPTLVIAPHIYSTLESTPGTWTTYGWGTEASIDFIRMWVAGAMTMFLYGVLRKATLSD
jgi:hypothetical protein